MSQTYRFVRPIFFGLLLGLLLVAGVGPGQVATAQQPIFDADRPVESLRQAAPPAASDSVLIVLATALQKARADTEISYGEYKDGVWFFQQQHPGFYGNFFGDPFYATYDVRYQKLALRRQLAEPDINPTNSFRNNKWFFCSPLGYDPAFNGQCRGLGFTVSDFFYLPSGPAFGEQNFASRRDRPQALATRGDADIQTRTAISASRTPDTSRVPVGDTPTPDRPDPEPSTSDGAETVAVDAPPSPTPETPTHTSGRLVSKIEVPDRVRAHMQETASSLERTKTLLRIRQEIRRRSERGQLSHRERARVAQRIAEDSGMDELTRSISRVRRTLTDHADRRPSERLDRNDIERRAQRRTANRSTESSTSESVQRRSEDAATSSESRRNRARTSENSSDDG